MTCTMRITLSRRFVYIYHLAFSLPSPSSPPSQPLTPCLFQPEPSSILSMQTILHYDNKNDTSHAKFIPPNKSTSPALHLILPVLKLPSTCTMWLAGLSVRYKKVVLFRGRQRGEALRHTKKWLFMRSRRRRLWAFTNKCTAQRRRYAATPPPPPL